MLPDWVSSGAVEVQHVGGARSGRGDGSGECFTGGVSGMWAEDSFGEEHAGEEVMSDRPIFRKSLRAEQLGLFDPLVDVVEDERRVNPEALRRAGFVRDVLRNMWVRWNRTTMPQEGSWEFDERDP